MSRTLVFPTNRVASLAFPRPGEAPGGTAEPACARLAVRGLLLDFGGVLYDDTVWRRWLLRLLSHVGLHTHYGSFFYLWDRDFAADVHCGRRTFRDALTAFLRSVGLRRSLIDEVMAACMGLRRDSEESTRPLPGVRCTLARLARMNLTLGILSDSELPADQLRLRLARFASPEAFHAVVSSYDLAQTKPAPENYRAALEQMALSAPEVAFVGHDAGELLGARSVGMPTIAFNGGVNIEADLYLDRFDQLADVVAMRPPLAAAG